MPGAGDSIDAGKTVQEDDSAHIEQKNWTHVRRLLGYVRYDSEKAREPMNDLYGQELRLFHNLFLPSVKLARKERIGSRLRRRYEAPQTPFQRAAASPAADPERLAELQRLRERLDPFVLSRIIQTKLDGIFQLSRSAAKKSPASVATPPRRAGVSETKDHSDAPQEQEPRAEKKTKSKKAFNEKRRPKPHDGLHS